MPMPLDTIQPEQAALLAALFAIALSEGLDDAEATALGAFIMSVGDLMAVIVAQRVLCNNDEEG